MLYREEDFVLSVELVSRVAKKEGNADGEEFTLKVNGILRESNFIKKECIPQAGTVFSVWRSKTASGYYGWHLSDY